MFTFKKDNKSAVLKEKTVEEKTRIGFRYRERKAPEEEPIQPEKQATTYDRMEDPQDNKKTDDVIEIFTEVEEALPLKENQETEPSTSKKKKIFIKKDMTGKPVYLEDTGEKLGTVFDTLYDKENNLIGYKIKDSKSDAVLSFHFDQFDEEKNGLIFIPGWYTKAVKTIEKLEFKDRISPEFTALLTDDAVSNEKLYEIFVKHDDEMAKHIEGAISLKEMLNNRLKVLEKQRISLKDNLMDLTEKRLIKDIDRREFSEDVMEHRRKVNILDVNINKCRELIRRLDLTSFGILGKNNLVSDSDIVIKDNLYERRYEDFKERNKLLYDREIENGKGTSYKEKYYTLKEQFEQLEDDYQELKMAVEKLRRNKLELEEKNNEIDRIKTELVEKKEELESRNIELGVIRQQFEKKCNENVGLQKELTVNREEPEVGEKNREMLGETWENRPKTYEEINRYLDTMDEHHLKSKNKKVEDKD